MIFHVLKFPLLQITEHSYTFHYKLNFCKKWFTNIHWMIYQILYFFGNHFVRILSQQFQNVRYLFNECEQILNQSGGCFFPFLITVVDLVTRGQNTISRVADEACSQWQKLRQRQIKGTNVSWDLTWTQTRSLVENGGKWRPYCIPSHLSSMV